MPKLTRSLPWFLVLGFLVSIGITFSSSATSTPMYAARAGRTCDNCHLDPSFWENPKLSERKCTLSCQGCHIDPSGGGMRTVAGRFYGKATLPLIGSEQRPVHDWDKTVFGMFYRPDKNTVYSDQLPRGPETVNDQDDEAYVADDFFAGGQPGGKRTPMSFAQGRYGKLQADPMLRVGWDYRGAILVANGPYDGQSLAFPMQADIHAAFQPYERFTLLANVGARGRSEGVESVFDDPRTPYLREAFVMVHELPYLAYLKAGRFTPTFGHRLDDHTSFIRRGLGLDASLPETRVTGFEVGMNPNYPYINLAGFWGKSPDEAPSAFDIFDTDPGFGTTMNIGYRHMGWSLGLSGMKRNRAVEFGGDTAAWGLNGAFNPWYYKRGLPFTYLFEIDRGEQERFSGSIQQSLIFFQELSWLVTNGVNVLVGHNYEDPDRDVAYDEAHRGHVGLQITPVSGFTIDTRFRALFPRRDERFVFQAPDPDGSDLFIQFHLWN